MSRPEGMPRACDDERWSEIEDALRLLHYRHVNSHAGVADAEISAVAVKHAADVDDVRAMWRAAIAGRGYPRPGQPSRPRAEWTCPVCGKQMTKKGSYSHAAAHRREGAGTADPKREDTHTPSSAAEPASTAGVTASNVVEDRAVDARHLTAPGSGIDWEMVLAAVAGGTVHESEAIAACAGEVYRRLQRLEQLLYKWDHLADLRRRVADLEAELAGTADGPPA